jgi:hypothetical protein
MRGSLGFVLRLVARLCELGLGGGRRVKMELVMGVGGVMKELRFSGRWDILDLMTCLAGIVGICKS